MFKNKIGVYALLILVSTTNIFGDEYKLEPCPDKPNCVISDASDTEHFIEGIKFTNDNILEVEKELFNAILELKGKVNKSERDSGNDKRVIVEASFFSNIFKFEDVATFVINMETKEILVRSGAKTGYYDLNVNRDRVEEIRKLIK